MLLRRFPLAAWITLSASLVAAGGYVRFKGSFLVSDQVVLGIFFFIAAFMTTLALICWLPLLRRLPDGRGAGRTVLLFVFGPALAMGLLAAMALETEAAAAARHRSHLMRLARIVADDYARRGRMPVLFDDALQRSTETLPHRGDANGRAVSYRKLDADTSVICAPDCRVHVLIQGHTIRYQPWPPGQPDPCGQDAHSAYWAGSDDAIAPPRESR